MRKRSYMNRLSALALASSMALADQVAQADPNTIYFDAPSPEELASQMFPPRYRSVSIGGEPGQRQQEAGFGMMINFEFDSTDITDESKNLLQSVGEMLGMEAARQRAIVIEGHTDAIGGAAYNQQLSEGRARAIKDYLVQQFGVAPKRLLVVGKGERELYAQKDPNAGINRRVTFRPAKKLVLK